MQGTEDARRATRSVYALRKRHMHAQYGTIEGTHGKAEGLRVRTATEGKPVEQQI